MPWPLLCISRYILSLLYNIVRIDHRAYNIIQSDSPQASRASPFYSAYFVKIVTLGIGLACTYHNFNRVDFFYTYYLMIKLSFVQMKTAAVLYSENCRAEEFFSRNFQRKIWG